MPNFRSAFLAQVGSSNGYFQLVTEDGECRSCPFNPFKDLSTGFLSQLWEGQSKDSRSALVWIEIKPSDQDNSRTVTIEGTAVTKLFDKSGVQCTVTITATDGKITSIIYTPITSGRAPTANLELLAEIAGAASGDCGNVPEDSWGEILSGNCGIVPDDNFDMLVSELIRENADHDTTGIEIVEPDTGAKTGLFNASTSDFDFTGPKIDTDDVENLLFVGTTCEEELDSDTSDLNDVTDDGGDDGDGGDGDGGGDD